MTVNGGQTVAQPPVQVTVVALSPSCSYSVIPFASTRIFPYIESANITDTGPGCWSKQAQATW